MAGDEVEVIVGADGTIQLVHDDDVVDVLLGEVAEVETFRASHVEPAGGGAWQADLGPVGGPLLGPFMRRSEALAAEVAWLAGRMAEGKVARV